MTFQVLLLVQGETSIETLEQSESLKCLSSPEKHLQLLVLDLLFPESVYSIKLSVSMVILSF